MQTLSVYSHFKSLPNPPNGVIQMLVNLPNPIFVREIAQCIQNFVLTMTPDLSLRKCANLAHNCREFALTVTWPSSALSGYVTYPIYVVTCTDRFWHFSSLR